MNKFEIIQNVARKGEKAPKAEKISKSVNYLAIPFKEMQNGDCVVVKGKGGRSNAKSCVKLGVKRALGILGLNPENFLVDWTKDKKNVAVWRVQ